ncbi:MAG TPA: ATP-binding protein [Mycobacteriales bacterium]|nr:ATP-binding protein [Mycobacteriales bacterium]
MPLHSQQLACNDSAPRMARAWVRLILARTRTPDGYARDGLAHDMVLCASELVTSSLIANSTTMTLSLSADPGRFRLSLLDDRPILSENDARMHVQSMGFRLIQTSSDACGIAYTDLGRELWALFRESESGDRPLLDVLITDGQPPPRPTTGPRRRP